MKNKLTTTLCVALIFVFVLSMSGCCIYTNYGAYFATWEDLDSYIREFCGNDGNFYLVKSYYVDMPDDERFKESAYMIYNTRGVYLGDDPDERIMNVFNYTAFRVEIDGEDVFIFGFDSGISDRSLALEKMQAEIDVSLDYLKPEDESIDYHNYEIRQLRSLPTIKEFAEKYSPEGFVKNWIGLSDEEVDEMFDTCKWFGYQYVSDRGTSLSIEYRYIWGVYDTRNVPQAEKDALALELMEILYNNYKLAGEKAE